MGKFTAFRENAYPKSQIAAFPATDGFAMECATSLAWAAQLAYEADNPEKLNRILAQWGWQRSVPLKGALHRVLDFTLASGYGAQVGQTTVIAFAGTEPDSATQWLENFAARPVNDMHEGFTAGIEAVWNAKDSTLPRLIDAATAIYFCGHSLGGALAVAAAHRLCRSKPDAAAKIRGVYTMGMPRVGIESFAQAYNSTPIGPNVTLGQRTFRLLHGQDLVPHLPPKFRPFGYRHVGCMLSCARGKVFVRGDLGPLVVEDAEVEATISIRDVLPRVLPDTSVPRFPAENDGVADAAAVLPQIFRDHLMDLYLGALGAL